MPQPFVPFLRRLRVRHEAVAGGEAPSVKDYEGGGEVGHGARWNQLPAAGNSTAHRPPPIFLAPAFMAALAAPAVPGFFIASRSRSISVAADSWGRSTVPWIA